MSQQTTAAGETERRLLAEADYVYDVENWEATHNDFGTLADEADIRFNSYGEIMVVGRLKALPHAYGVNLPTTFDDDGDPVDWEVAVFETREAAVAAWTAALGEQSRHSPDETAAQPPQPQAR
jgi:hypothetical protein